MQIFEKRLFKNRCTSYNLNKFNTNMFAIRFGNKIIKSKIFSKWYYFDKENVIKIYIFFTNFHTLFHNFFQFF